jgi:hypothetical protein
MRPSWHRFSSHALRERATKVKLIDDALVERPGDNMGTIEARLQELGIALPPPRPMPANFIPATVLGEVCWVS